MKTKLKAFLEAILNRLPSKSSFLYHLKRTLRLLLYSSACATILYFTHMHVYESGQRMGQCEVGCWTMGGALLEVDENDNCICIENDGEIFLKIVTNIP